MLGLCALAGVALAVALAFGGPLLRFNLRMSASGLRARVVDAVFGIYDPFGDDPLASCNCSSDWEYRCSDPSSAYAEKIRRDPRLAALFDEPPNRLETYAHHQNFLRDQFAKGPPTNPLLHGYNILEKLDDAAAGSPFLCDDIARMFVELVQAHGGFARLVSLVDVHGSGHVVTEAWVDAFGKWVVFDPDYNVYYTDADGTPLHALELHEIHRSGRYDRARAHAGPSVNSAYNRSCTRTCSDISTRSRSTGGRTSTPRFRCGIPSDTP